jgi:hypothetical protein
VQRVDPRRQQRVGALLLVPLEEVAQLDVGIVRGGRPHPCGRQLAAARVHVLAGALPADLGVDAQVLAGAEPEGQDLGLLPQFLLLVRLQLAQLLEHLGRGSENLVLAGTKQETSAPALRVLRGLGSGARLLGQLRAPGMLT